MDNGLDEANELCKLRDLDGVLCQRPSVSFFNAFVRTLVSLESRDLPSGPSIVRKGKKQTIHGSVVYKFGIAPMALEHLWALDHSGQVGSYGFSSRVTVGNGRTRGEMAGSSFPIALRVTVIHRNRALNTRQGPFNCEA